jgi:hypothetical protein
MTSFFSADDLIFYKEDEQIKSGGYAIKSALLNDNISPMTTMNILAASTGGGGEKVSTPFENLAVPAGLFFINQKVPKNYTEEHWKKHEAISDDIYDKLFDLIRMDDKKKRKTKKHSLNTKHKKTRKH